MKQVCLLIALCLGTASCITDDVVQLPYMTFGGWPAVWTNDVCVPLTLTLDDVPSDDTTVQLQFTGNGNTFASASDCNNNTPATAHWVVPGGEGQMTFYARTGAVVGSISAQADGHAPATLNLRAQLFQVVGEPDATTVLPVRYGLTNPTNVFTPHGKLLVADEGNGRVLIWNSVPTNPNTAPSIVLGQPDADTAIANNLASSVNFGMSGFSVWGDGQRLVLASKQQNRVLVWNTWPTRSNQPADFALGQPADANNLVSTVANNGGVSGATLWGPGGVTSDGNRLFVADSLNARVLVWNTFPSSAGAPADFALGYANDANNLTTAPGSAAPLVPGATAANLNNPGAITTDGNRLFVADLNNYRVLIWNTLPSQGGQPADGVVGQTSLTTRTRPTAITGDTITTPYGVVVVNNTLLIADSTYSRVLVWNSVPTTPGASADYALGTPSDSTNLTSAGGGVSATLLSAPWGLASDGNNLWIGDSSNSRVLGWSNLPTNANTPADLVLGHGANGQADFNAAKRNDPGPGGYQPEAVASDGTQLAITDGANARVLIWHTAPTSSMQAPTVVLGQSSLASVQSRPVAANSVAATNLPVAMARGHLFVADSSNNRVLIWNSVPVIDDTPADVVLGQPTMTSSYYGCDANALYGPHGISSDGNRLVVTDSSNNRVLIWNSIPTTDGQPADVVLGQTDFTSCSASLGATTLNYPMAALLFDNKLAVSDLGNTRILIFDPVPTSSAATPSAVLGPADFTSTDPNATLQFPYSMAADERVFAVVESPRNRVLLWHNVAQLGGPPEAVLGQADMTASLPNGGQAVGASGLSCPQSLTMDATRYWIADTCNDRVLLVPR